MLSLTHSYIFKTKKINKYKWREPKNFNVSSCQLLAWSSMELDGVVFVKEKKKMSYKKGRKLLYLCI
jgi:hypothetical protein